MCILLATLVIFMRLCADESVTKKCLNCTPDSFVSFMFFIYILEIPYMLQIAMCGGDLTIYPSSLFEIREFISSTLEWEETSRLVNELCNMIIIIPLSNSARS